MHTIFFDWTLKRHAGGPTGYLYNLSEGLKQIRSETAVRFVLRDPPPVPAPGQAAPVAPDDRLRRLIAYYTNPDNFFLPQHLLQQLLAVPPTSLHCHTSPQGLQVVTSMQAGRLPRALTLFSSHTPESIGTEIANIWRARGSDLRLCQAFAQSDVWLFPSEHALQPYLESIPDFAALSQGKDIRFVATGTYPLSSVMGPEDAKRAFGVEGTFVVTFIGRHNRVKGYDIFVEACLPLLEAMPELAVVVAGESASARPPKHARWRELGWLDNPGDLFAATDLFVLPNRSTYFDLILIEAMSMGVACLAAATGGNRDVAATNPDALALFDGTATDLRARIVALRQDAHKRRALATAARKAYAEHYTLQRFATGYLKTITAIWRDYGLGPQAGLGA